MVVTWQPWKWKWPGSLGGWDNFALYVILFFIIPLLPIGLEWVIKKSISEGSLLIATAMYAIAIGTASRIKTLFGLALLISLAYSCLFGVATYAEHKNKEDLKGALRTQTLVTHAMQDQFDKINDDTLPYACRMWSVIAIFVVTIIHGIDRFMRHVISNQPVFDF